jgi:hypothetical protein
MANILKNTNQTEMRLHIEKAREIIEAHLPTNYCAETRAKLPVKFKLSDHTIRNVAQKKSNNLDVLNAMVEVALEHKEKQEKLKNLVA